ncbi:2Fe-2S ferredoxin-type domain-containing protein [Gamsiella multidivaricata]|uniref:2Fe-2S ferredoxin-type domain-containing protein n=1 Tax=Gamsiella multidivaricata TaxID=101098 RepID=UPI00221F9F17|nr:2Fe-2S ferredoxin-type domain-containing protein [Gamsiella multidivaricata]KAI7823368.1 2Fe-2S ferredoxin-type domain-containing protein [Gamsiella multidivaricata]
MFAMPLRNDQGIQYAKRGRPGPGEGFTVNFIMQDGEEITVQAHEGESLLDAAWANDIDIEGACEASLACSTCHLILDTESYSKLEEPTDEENDMLDLAFGLTDTSRLGCQVLMNKELDGIVAKLPAITRNASA